MSKQTIAALKTVLAILEQQRESLKHVVKLTHFTREGCNSDAMRMYLTGKLKEAVSNVQRVQGTIRDIQFMIKGLG